MQDFRSLKVWEKAHALVFAVYTATQHFPKEEIYGLTSQIRRAAVSIPANIAEGCGKEGDVELIYSEVKTGKAYCLISSLTANS